MYIEAHYPTLSYVWMRKIENVVFVSYFWPNFRNLGSLPYSWKLTIVVVAWNSNMARVDA